MRIYIIEVENKLGNSVLSNGIYNIYVNRSKLNKTIRDFYFDRLIHRWRKGEYDDGWTSNSKDLNAGLLIIPVLMKLNIQVEMDV